MTQARAVKFSKAKIAFACSAGVLLGSGAMTFRYAEGLSYMSNDPRACINCHVMRDQYDGWQKAAHHAYATCNDCHVPHDLIGKYMTKAEHGYRHSKGFTFQDFHEPIQMKPSSRAVVIDNCVRCHAPLVSEIKSRWQPASDPHAGGTSVLDCLRCHERVAHGPTR